MLRLRRHPRAVVVAIVTLAIAAGSAFAFVDWGADEQRPSEQQFQMPSGWEFEP